MSKGKFDFVSIPTFKDHNNKIIVQFVPITNVPGFTHRVTMNGAAYAWLGDNAKPNRKSAEYFLDRYLNTIDKAARKPKLGVIEFNP